MEAIEVVAEEAPLGGTVGHAHLREIIGGLDGDGGWCLGSLGEDRLLAALAAREQRCRPRTQSQPQEVAARYYRPVVIIGISHRSPRCARQQALRRAPRRIYSVERA